jgi:hypothetical protein
LCQYQGATEVSSHFGSRCMACRLHTSNATAFPRPWASWLAIQGSPPPPALAPPFFLLLQATRWIVEATSSQLSSTPQCLNPCDFKRRCRAQHVLHCTPGGGGETALIFFTPTPLTTMGFFCNSLDCMEAMLLL